MALQRLEQGRRLMQQGQPSATGSIWKQIWSARWCYLFLLPGLVLAGMFTFWPTVASWYYSLLNWSGFTSEKTFVGLANYQQIIHDQFFWNAFMHSFLFLIGNLPIRLGLALIIAIILNDKALRLAPVFRTMFFIPVVTSTAIVGIVMTFVLSPFHGPVNQALLDLHFIPRAVDFLGDPHSALWAVVGTSIWKDLGIPMIYWLAALQTIPHDVYEAAKVDGSNPLQTARYVTLPLLVPFAIVIILITAVNTLNVFAIVQTMTGGGPYFASDVVETYIYRTAFGSAETTTVPQLGYASAGGVIFGVAIMLIALLQGLAVKRLRDVRQEMSAGGGQ